MPAQVGLLAGRAIKRVLRNPAQMVFPIVFPLVLLAVNASGLDAATNLPGFPVRQLPGLRARHPVHAGRAVRGAQRRAGPRARHRGRLPRPPRDDADVGRGAARRTARRRALHGPDQRRAVPRGRHRVRRGDRDRRRRRARAARALAGDLVGICLLRHVRRAARRHRRGRAGLLSALLRDAVSQLGVLSARPHRAGLVCDDRDLQPRLLHGRGDPQPRDRRLGRAGARRRRSLIAAIAIVGFLALSARALRTRLVRT